MPTLTRWKWQLGGRASGFVARRKPLRCRPTVHPLEDRLTPALSLLVNGQATDVLPAATAGSPVSIAFTASQTGTYNFGVGQSIYFRGNVNTVIGSDLPPGLTPTATPQSLTIQGTPTVAGAYTVIVQAVAQADPADTVQVAYSLVVGSNVSLGAAPSQGSVGTPFHSQLTAAGGVGSPTFSLVGGSLPPGLALAGDGGLSGTPAAAGTYSANVAATYGTGPTAVTNNRVYTFAIAPAVTFTGNGAALPIIPNVANNYVAVRGVTFALPVNVGTGDDYSYTAVNPLPAGMSLALNADTGVWAVQGSPSAAGNYSFTVRGTDGQGNTADLAFGLTVLDPTTGSVGAYGLPFGLPTATYGAAYPTQTIGLAGGTGTPAGLSGLSITQYDGTAITPAALAADFGLTVALTAGGQLVVSGTPTKTPADGGYFTISVTAAYAVGGTSFTTTQQFTLNVSPPPERLAILGPVSGGLAPAVLGAAYAQQLSASNLSGGSGNYVFSFPDGKSPLPWLGLSAGGQLTNTATISGSAGQHSVIVVVTDATTGFRTSRVFTLTVANPAGAVQLSPTPLQPYYLGVPTSQTITASGGSGTYGITYTLQNGPLPPGLSITATADSLTIGGTPTLALNPASGNFAPTVVRVTVTDAGGGGTSVTQDYVVSAGVSPQQVKQAYGFDGLTFHGAAADGRGQTVVIVVSGGGPNLVSSDDPNFVSSDLYQYDQMTGLNYYSNPPAGVSPKFYVIDEFGGTNYPAPQAGEADEFTQDVLWVHALAPGADIVFVVTQGGNTDFLTAYQTALNLSIPGLAPASVVSTSYASDENTSAYSGPLSLANLFSNPGGPPVTFLFAAGDQGNDSNTVEYYGAIAGAVAVGYTDLTGYTDITLAGQGPGGFPESVVIGSGGGASDQLPQYGWQQGVTNATSPTTRGYPDVVLVGDPYTGAVILQTYGNPSPQYPFENGDGSSLATPGWAALMAIANQGRATNGLPALDGDTTALPLLYSFAGGTYYNTLNQVLEITGSGTLTTQVSSAFGNFNPFAGLGSPKANALLPALAAAANGITGKLFLDLDGDGVLDGSDPGLAGWTVYLDADGDGVLDPGEVRTTTAANGTYGFLVVAGGFAVRAAPPAGYAATSAGSVPVAFAADFGGTAAADFGFQGLADITVTKTDGRSTARPGSTLVYTVVASNAGPTAASGVVVTDDVPSVLTGVTWTATFAGGAAGAASGTGSIGQLVDLPVGGSVTYTVTATVGGTASGTIRNTAVVTAPAGTRDTNPADNSSTDTTIIPAPPVPPIPPVPPPVPPAPPVPPVPPVPVPPLVVPGVAADGEPVVRVIDPATGRVLADLRPFGPGFTGPISVAVADVTGDGVADIVVGAGVGGGPRVVVYTGTDYSVAASFFAYAPAFTGGVSVAAADLDGDGVAEIVTGAGAGGGPHVRVFDGRTLAAVASFFAYAPAFTGGVSVAAADLDGDGVAEIVTGAGAGGGPHVRVFDGRTLAAEFDYMAFAASFTGGVSVAAGSGYVAAGAGPGGGPAVQARNGFDPSAVLAEFFASDESYTGGVTLVAEPDGSLLVTAASASGPPAGLWNPLTGSFLGGVPVG